MTPAGDAEDALARGKALLAQASVDSATVEAAVAAFRQALVLQPGFAPARQALADALLFHGNGLLEHDLPRAAERLYRQAIGVQPGFADAVVNLGQALVAQNRVAEAIAAHRTALTLQPADPAAEFALAHALLLDGQTEAGWHQYEARRRLASPDADRRPDLPRWEAGQDVAGRHVLVMAEQGVGDAIQFARLVPLLARRAARVTLEVPAVLRDLVAGLPGVAAVIVPDDPTPACDLLCPMMSLPLLLGYDPERQPLPVPYLQLPPARLAAWRHWLEAADPGSCTPAPPAARPTDPSTAPPIARPAAPSTVMPGPVPGIPTGTPAAWGDAAGAAFPAGLPGSSPGMTVEAVPAEVPGLDPGMTAEAVPAEVRGLDPGVTVEAAGGAPARTLRSSPGMRLDVTGQPARRIGLSISGDTRHGRDRLRSIPLARFAPLFDLPNHEFVLLQPWLRETDTPPPQLRLPGAELRDFADTAALIRGLDLVIAADTGVAHLAGALGCPVWALLPFAPDFRWRLHGTRTAWYPTMTLYRQILPNDWDTPIAAVRRDLVAWQP